MEECNICCFQKKADQFKTMNCGKKICKKCYTSLIIPKCPYCRKDFKFTKEENALRIKEGVDVNYNFNQNIDFNVQDFNDNNIATSHIRRNRNVNTRQERNNINSVIDDYDIYINPRSERRRNRRIQRNEYLNYVAENNNQRTANDRRRKRSRRRRSLSDSEISERRRMIKKRQKNSYIKKTRRAIKNSGSWYY